MSRPNGTCPLHTPPRVSPRSYPEAVDDPSDTERAPYDPMPHGPAEVGVGPWEGPLPEGEQYDATLLAEGDRRNVVDRYRYWTLEAIVADLDTRRHDFHVAIENWQHDFNIGTIVRTANALAVRTIAPMLKSCCQFSIATCSSCRCRSRSATIASSVQ